MQLSLGITAGAPATTSQPTEPGVSGGAQAQAASTPNDPLGTGSGPAAQDRELPVAGPEPDPAPPFPSQTKEGKWALRSKGEERPAGFSRSRGRPQLPTS